MPRSICQSPELRFALLFSISRVRESFNRPFENNPQNIKENDKIIVKITKSQSRRLLTMSTGGLAVVAPPFDRGFESSLHMDFYIRKKQCTQCFSQMVQEDIVRKPVT